MRAFLFGAVLMLAACGEGGGPLGASAPANLCEATPKAEVERALGAGIDAATIAKDNGAPDEGCSWMANDGAAPRTLTFTVFRKSALDARQAPASGRALYDEALQALRAKYARVGALDQIGEEGFMGVSDAATAQRFSAEIVAIKGADVLTLQIEGEDPTAFEAVARAVSQAM